MTPTKAMEYGDEPHFDHVATRWYPDCVMTHAIWHNSYGSREPETGLLMVEEGTAIADSFRLIQHYTSDFDLAERVIIRGFRKSWDAYKIAQTVEWLGKRGRKPADK